jgi:Fic family protein
LIVFEFTGTENHPVYESLHVDNGNRQYDFIRSIVAAAVALKRPFLSSAILRALNFHAIACLHPYAGEYRSCKVTVGDYDPPDSYMVPSLMEDFINQVNYEWERADPVALAAFVLWRLNYIHPFINGNGRTARAACYFVLCMRLGGWLRGETILPEAIRQNRPEYVAAIKAADASFKSGQLDHTALHALLTRLLAKQLEIELPASEANGDGNAAPVSEDPPKSDG